MRNRKLAHALFAAVLCFVAAAADAQIQTGDIYGTVTDPDGKALPGVSVTLTGVGAPRTAQTDAGGRFRFVGLYPGEYTVRAELEGFAPVEQTGVGVRLGGKVELDISLSGAIEEVITVTSEAAIINPRELNQGPALSQEELDRIPTARDPWSLLAQAPGVIQDRINVGGNESGQQADFAAAGATASDNTFAVDGVVLTDMAAVGASATYFDFGAYEEIQLTTASTDVTIQTAGVTINQVTKRGTNEWRGDGRYLKTEGDWQSDPEEANGNRIDSVEEYGANFGGPIVTDHLWGWASYGESDIGNIAQGGQLDRTNLEDLNIKLNWQAGANAGVAHFWTNDKLKSGRNAGPLFAPESTWDQTTPQDIWKIEDTHVFGSSLYLTGLYSKDDGAFTLHPPSGLDSNMYYDEDGVVHGGYFDFVQDAIIEQYRADANVFFGTGDWQHELKFGAGYREQENTSLSQLPRGRYVHACEDYGCEPTDEEGNFLEDTELVVWIRHNVAVTSEYQSAWIQDTITSDRWTITGGLRYDNQSGENRPHFDAGSPEAQGFLPAISFPGNDAGGLEWESIVPRVGVTYALGEERRTLLRGTFSQYAAQLGQSIISRTDPLAPYSYVYFYFQDVNRNLVFEPEEAGSLAYYYIYSVNYYEPGSIVSPNRNDPNLDPYKTDEATFSVQHALASNLLITGTVTWRNTHDLLEFRELILDEAGNERPARASDYVFVGDNEASLPDGTTVLIPEYDLADGLSRTGGSFLTNGDREIEYLGVSLGFQKRLADGWGLRGNVTWSDNKLKVGDEFRAHDDPTDYIFTGGDGFYGGYGDDDDVYAYQSGYRAKRGVVLQNSWSFNLNGMYQVAPEEPWGFNVAANITGREGYPSPPYIGSNSRQLQLTDDFDDFRNEDVISVDVRVDKDFQIGDLRLTASLDAFNLFDNQPVLQQNRNFTNEADPFVIERLSPRVFRWGLMFHFR
jgi:hypothetical protein